MGWWGDLWNKVKAPFTAIYDNVIKPVANTASNIYDRVKSFLPAVIRAPLDTVQGTGQQIGNAISIGRDAMDRMGLKNGGEILRERAKMEQPKNYYQR